MSAAISRTVSFAGTTLATVLIEEGPFTWGDSDISAQKNCGSLTYVSPSAL